MSEAMYEIASIRQLQVGEPKNPGTDIYVYPDGFHGVVELNDPASSSHFYRISLAQPVAEPASEAPAEAGGGYYIEGKEVTQDELYRHVGAKVFEGLRKGNLPGCNSEVMRLRNDITTHVNRGAELAKQLTKAESELADLKRANAELDARIVQLESDCVVYLKEIGELQSQLASAKPAAVEYAWRDATPEDVGKGYKAQVRDELSRGFVHLGRILTGYAEGERLPWITAKNGTEAKWRFCQVYAPVEAEAAKPAPQEEWRELTKGDQYSGPGQVTDDDPADGEQEWMDAIIMGVDSDCEYPFVAKAKGSGYGGFEFARVRKDNITKGNSND